MSEIYIKTFDPQKDELWVKFTMKSGADPWKFRLAVHTLTARASSSTISNMFHEVDNTHDIAFFNTANKLIYKLEGIINAETPQTYYWHIKSGIGDGIVELYKGNTLVHKLEGRFIPNDICEVQDVFGLEAFSEFEFLDSWTPTPEPSPEPDPEPTPDPQPDPEPTPEPDPEPQPEPEDQEDILEILDIRPREAHISFDWGGRKHTFFSGTKQIGRTRIRPKKVYELTVSGNKKTLDYILDFYNRHEGANKKFIFNYDGVNEICAFTEKLQIDEKREIQSIVGFEVTLMIEAMHDNIRPVTAEEGEHLPLKPFGNVTLNVDWNTNIVEMGLNGRQKTYTEPVRTYSIKLSGHRQHRDAFLEFYRKHGSHVSFILPYDDEEVEVLFPSTIEVDDKLEAGQVVGFECELDLEEVRKPNDGKQGIDPTPTPAKKRRVSLRNFAKNGYYLQGEEADGICYKDCMDALSSYIITDCYAAFEGSDLEEIPYLDTSECTDFAYMFKNSKIKHHEVLDTSQATSMSEMYYGAEMERLAEFDASNITSASQYGGGVLLPGVFQNSKIRIIERVKLGTTGYALFKEAKELQRIIYINTKKIEDMGSMFTGCEMLNSLPTIDMRVCTSAESMFNGCAGLPAVRLCNTGKLVNVTYMFTYCAQLKSVTGLNLRSAEHPDEWGNPRGLVCMFQHCYSLNAITVMDDDLPYEEAKAKYMLLMRNYGLLDGRYRNRYILKTTVVMPSDTYTFYREDYIEG